jgi:hypothetical protein
MATKAARKDFSGPTDDNLQDEQRDIYKRSPLGERLGPKIQPSRNRSRRVLEIHQNRSRTGSATRFPQRNTGNNRSLSRDRSRSRERPRSGDRSRPRHHQGEEPHRPSEAWIPKPYKGRPENRRHFTHDSDTIEDALEYLKRNPDHLNALAIQQLQHIGKQRSRTPLKSGSARTETATISETTGSSSDRERQRHSPVEKATSPTGPQRRQTPLTDPPRTTEEEMGNDLFPPAQLPTEDEAYAKWTDRAYH